MLKIYNFYTFTQKEHIMEIIGEHSSLKEVFKILNKVAPTDSTVLVTGESGTGKELLVRALHNRSLRAKKPFIPINCGAIPKDLLESELFGHEKGSFTGAMNTKLGRFELAEGGTIFLDEIGEMDMSLQVKILRVLQEKEIERVGGNGPRKVDVRIVAATNRDLEKEVEANRFREDLYYRLNVIPIHLPPLRERKDDILLLIKHFLHHFCMKKGREDLSLSQATQQIFLAYPWFGNVRELENFMERLSILVDTNCVEVEDIPAKILNTVGNLEELPPITQNYENILLSNNKEEENNQKNSTQNEKTEDIKKKKALLSLSSAGNASQNPLFAQNETHTEAKAKDIQSILNPPLDLTDLNSENQGFTYPGIADLEQRNMGLKEFLESIENKLIDEALEKCEHVKNQAAEMLGIKRTTLIEKLKKRNIE